MSDHLARSHGTPHRKQAVRQTLFRARERRPTPGEKVSVRNFPRHDSRSSGAQTGETTDRRRFLSVTAARVIYPASNWKQNTSLESDIIQPSFPEDATSVHSWINSNGNVPYWGARRFLAGGTPHDLHKNNEPDRSPRREVLWPKFYAPTPTPMNTGRS